MESAGAGKAGAKGNAKMGSGLAQLHVAKKAPYLGHGETAAQSIRRGLVSVTSRGDRHEAIYEDDDDRQLFLAILGEVVTRCQWLCDAYGLIGTHDHLVLETPEGHLAKSLRPLYGVSTQRSNLRHGRVGHLFQGRYPAILVESEASG